MKSPRFAAAAASAVVVVAAAGLRALALPRSLDDVGPRALADVAFALLLLLVVLLVAAGIGRGLLRRIGAQGLRRVECLAVVLPLGLGVLSYLIFGLGLVGLFKPWAFVVLLGAVAIASWRDIERSLLGAAHAIGEAPAAWARLAPAQRVLLLVAGLILLTTLPQALTPPWDYDGLMYHLEGPRLFLADGRITLLPNLWQANGPFAIEMLYALGLGLGSDVFAKLLHLAYAVMLVVACFALGRRMLGPATAWWAVAVLLGIPILTFWATLAYADMAWALYQFQALALLILWKQDTRPRWLLLAGVMAGLALGSKYLAVGPVLVLVGLVCSLSWKNGWGDILRRSGLFLGAAVLVASPWYLKNWVLAANPVYPFFFGGPDWPRERVDLLMTYLQSFGTGRRMVDYLLLPWSIYARYQNFGTFMRIAELPSFLFPLGLAVLWTRARRTLVQLAGVTVGWVVIWAIGSQQTRFLLACFPAFSLFAAVPLERLASGPRLKRLRRGVAGALVAFGLVLTVAWNLFIAMEFRPLPVIIGAASKRTFLTERVSDFAAIRYIAEDLPPDGRVFMMWDGQGYYCNARCAADADQSGWTLLARADPDPKELAARLRAMGFTYLLYSQDAEFFFKEHDPTGAHGLAGKYFFEEFAPACAQERFVSGWATLYEITCGQG